MTPPRLRTFLAAARNQALDLSQSFAAGLIVRRRRQFAVVLSSAVIAGAAAASAVRGAERARASWSTCPTLPTTTEPLAPADWRVVALPRDMVAPPVHPGDSVDLVSQAVVLAQGALVVSAATDSNGVNVAVPPGSAPTVASAAQTGDISMLLAGR